MKGLFDKNKTSVSFIVTGSARLDYYRKGGDSLQGRYHYYRLHPFTLMECGQKPDNALVAQLLKFGGFPSLFSGGRRDFTAGGCGEHSARVIYEDSAIWKMCEKYPCWTCYCLTCLPAWDPHFRSTASANSYKWLTKPSNAGSQSLKGCTCAIAFHHLAAKRIRAVRKEKKLYFGTGRA